MKLITWNMDYWKRTAEQRLQAWEYLTKTIAPDIAMLQEIVIPEEVYDEQSVIFSPVIKKQGWGSATVAKKSIRKVYPISGGYTGSSGVIVTEIPLTPELVITSINIYGKLDEYGYASTTMHHILSDLTHLLDNSPKRYVLLGGDFNVSPQYDEKYRGKYASHRLVFDRLKDFGLTNCTMHFHEKYVQTHVHSKSKYPWQNDYLFANNRLLKRITDCYVINEPEVLGYSDHLPVVIELQ